jgi:hypothetical protein
MFVIPVIVITDFDYQFVIERYLPDSSTTSPWTRRQFVIGKRTGIEDLFPLTSGSFDWDTPSG